jgi:hypothetical protein
VEEEEKPETPDAPETPDPPPEADPIAEILGETPPAFVTALDAVADSERARNPNWKGFAVDPKDLTPAAQQLVHNLRGVVTRATQAAAEEKRANATERAALEKERAALAKEKAGALSMFSDPRFKTMLDQAIAGGKDKDGKARDPFNDDDRKALVEAEAAAILQKFLGQINTVTSEQIAEAQKGAAILELEDFAKEHPDFDEALETGNELFQRITEIRKGANLSAQDAYLLAKAKAPAKPEAKKEPVKDAKAEAKKASRAASARPEAPSTKPSAPKTRDVHEINKFYRDNPGAQSEALNAMRRGSTSY